jgi:aminoglycoside/choline kinase family phosphotransferase
MKKYNVDGSKCFIFEDSKTGILSAKSAYPKCLIGIETIYDNKEITNFGVDMSIKNYLNLEICQLTSVQNVTIEKLTLFIKNSVPLEIEEVIFDKQKLKGGNIADVMSLKITTKNGKSHHCVFKLENKNVTDLSTMANQLKLYDREYYFYKEVSPFLNIEVPKMISLVRDNDYNVCGILLENLYYRNTTFELNLDLNERNINISLQIIENMAKMHAKFWNKNISHLFPGIKKNNDVAFCPFFENYINEKWPIFTSKWNNVLSVEQLDKCEKIINTFPKIQQRLCNNNQTLVHGDIKSPNIFYDVKNDYSPIFLDWQHCVVGKGVQDFIFFVIESFNINNLELFFPIFKNYYYNQLIHNEVKNYSYEEYNQDIKDAICYIPLFTTVWFGTVPYDELIDKNFPFFFMQKLFYFIDKI